ncbi:Gfo/Idh/MocA family oxidoreductase [Actinocorallia lasiicapitis]
MTVRWGIIGAGGIADAVCADVALSAGSVVGAVAARDPERAARFAARHGAARSYGNYTELVHDPDVDLVYIATTHPHHRDQALLAIEAGKPVLIEKPVCLNAADTRTVLDAAKQAGVFAMEAMWIRLNPLVRRTVELIGEGAIGEPRGMRAEFCIGLPFDPASRLYELANGGGALLDLGIYPVTLAYLLFGAPDTVQTAGTLAPTGADDTVAMTWLYGGDPRVQLRCGASTLAPDQAAILGTTGWIRLDGVCRPSALTLHSGGHTTLIDDPIAGQGHGYGPEIAEVERCLAEGLIESPLVPHAETIAIMELLDGARAALGVRYPGE